MTRDEKWALAIGLLVIFMLMLMPVRAHAQAASTCYRTKAGIVCPVPSQNQNGGSGITPVKRWKA